MAQVKLGAKIQHSCFPSPLPFVKFVGEGVKQAPGQSRLGLYRTTRAGTSTNARRLLQR